MSYTIGEMCRAGRTTPRGIRFWETKGLLGMVERDGLGRRLYDDEHLRRAKIIAACQFGEMSIEEILAVLVAYDEPTRAKLSELLYDVSREIRHRADDLPFPMEYDL